MNSRIKLFTLLACAAFAGAASAQEKPDVSYDGKWSATILADNGTRQVSRLVLSNFGGTWYGATGRAADAKKPCSGKRFPVTVQESNADELDFTVWGTAIGPSCKDLTIELKPTATNVLEGTVASVGTIRLVRR